MFQSRPLAEQLAACSADQLRVLIVGAGVAGVTAAQLLRSNGLHPVLIERTAEQFTGGYMIALMPMVDAAMAQLGARPAYHANSIPMADYRVLSNRGAVLREDRLADLFAGYGDYRGLSREKLLETLGHAGCAVTTGAEVTALAERDDEVLVDIEATGATLQTAFDLVVIADGIHSSTRRFVPGGRDPQRTVTGWGGWVAWTEDDDDPTLGEELWGDGFFVGSYPVAGGVGAFVGGPRDDMRDGPSAFVNRIRGRLTHETRRLGAVLDAVAAADEPFFWVLDDVRTEQWTTGRSVLLGDAAAGFLPTAGIGAGMAIESAWVLANTLADANPSAVPERLSLYEAEQRPRVESAQSSSRQLARYMFSRSTALAIVRNLLMRVMSVTVALKPITALLEKPARVPTTGRAGMR